MHVKTTTDYTRFKNIVGNRGISNAQVRKLQESIKQYPELAAVMPVVCNEKGEVIDGQHRITAFKGLDMPVHYIEVKGLNLKDVQTLNSTAKKWSTLDYVKSYASTHNTDYIKLLEANDVLSKEFNSKNINLAATLHCSPKQFHTVGVLIKEGLYKYHENRELINIWKDYMTALPERQSYFKTRIFIKSLYFIIGHPKYNHKRMVKNLKSVGTKHFEKTAPQTMDSVVVAFEGVFNHAARSRTTFN